MNPCLVTITRGASIESRHCGAIAVVDATGRLIAHAGDVARPVYPRSAVKALQCVALIESGAAERFAFGAGDIAIACASHSGTPAHVARTSAILSRIGLDANALECGAHWPTEDDSMRALVRSGAVPDRRHNNCSGKHSGMLATACHAGVATARYTSVDHPVQRGIAGVLGEFTQLDLATTMPGVDGCGAPNWPVPIDRLAGAFASFATGEGMAAARRDVCRRILEACWAHPDMVAGPGRLDTQVLTAGQGRLFLKTGAEGVYCAAVPEFGLGIALKIDDGAARGSETAVLTILSALHDDLEAIAAPRRVVRNWAGEAVGLMLPSPELAEVAAQVAVAVGRPRTARGLRGTGQIDR